MAEAILKISECFIEGIMIFIFLNILLKRRYSRIITIIAGVAFTFTAVLICSSLEITLNIIILTVLLSAMAIILYSDKPVVNFSFVLISLYIPTITKLILEHLFFLTIPENISDISTDNFEYKLIFAVVVIIINTLLYLLIFKILNNTDKTAVNKFWTLFSGIMILFLSGSGFFRRIHDIAVNVSDGSLMYLVDVALFFFMSLLIIYLFAEINKGFKRDSKLFLLQNNYNSLQEQIAMQEQKNEIIKKIRHDMNNNLTNIRTLISNGQISDATKLLDKAAENIQFTNSGESINLGNNFVDAIILSKIAVCKEKGIDFTYSVEPVENLKIDVVDLSSLLSNLLDNAIEAAENSPNPFIKLSIFKYNAYYTVCIENSYKGKESVKTSSDMLISTKADKAFHGYGTQIISDIAKKYDGNYSWEAREEKFITSVIIKW